MNELPEGKIPRGKILVRFIFTIICLIVLYFVQFLIQIVTMLQYIILLITRNYSEPLRRFSNKAAAYAYRLIRYVTLNENARPFPFADFPAEMEPPEETVRFD